MTDIHKLAEALRREYIGQTMAEEIPPCGAMWRQAAETAGVDRPINYSEKRAVIALLEDK